MIMVTATDGEIIQSLAGTNTTTTLTIGQSVPLQGEDYGTTYAAFNLADRTSIEYDGGLEKILANINPTYSPWGILGEWKLDSFTVPSLPCPENVAEFPAKVEALDPYSSSSRSGFTECTGVSLIEPNYG